jgi:hypothetical protein
MHASQRDVAGRRRPPQATGGSDRRGTKDRMAITRELERLGSFAERLSQGSEELNRLIERIDQALGRLGIGLDYFMPRPLDEHTTFDHSGKRVIEVGYLGYCKVSRNHHLVIKTVKVLESKLAVTTEQPGSIVPLLAAPRRLRYSAVDMLPELVTGLAAQVEEMVGSMQRRQATAARLLAHLEEITGPITSTRPSASGTWQPPPEGPGQGTGPAAGSATETTDDDRSREAPDQPRTTRLMGSPLERR